MISANRIAKAQAELMHEAAELRRHAAKVRAMCAAGGILDKQNGKTINARLRDLVAAAYGLEKKPAWNGEMHYFGASWRPAQYGSLARVEIEIPLEGWGSYYLEIAEDDAGRIDAEATRAKWLASCEDWEKCAAKHERAAGKVERAAMVYNEIERAANALFAELEGDGSTIHDDITVLCALKGEVHKRLSAFRWSESAVPRDWQ